MAHKEVVGVPLDEVRKHYETLANGLPSNQRRAQLDKLLSSSWDPKWNRVAIAEIHLTVFEKRLQADSPKSAIAAANKAVNRLIDAVNHSAHSHKVPLTVSVTSERQRGAAQRYLWFERYVPARHVNMLDEPELHVSELPQYPTRAKLTDKDYCANRYIPDVLGVRDDLVKHGGAWGDPEAKPSSTAEPVVAMDYLLQWLDEPDAPVLFALLGEYGMGKTVTCQALKQRLDAEREQDPSRREALYFDLRWVTGLDRRVPDLKEVCEECMHRGWTGAFGFDDVLRWTSAGALVIFDGLDEVLVRLSAADGQAFTRTLLGLPDLVREHGRDQTGDRAQHRATRDKNNERRRPRLLISCRTHYFRTLRDQKNHFTAQERIGPEAADYRALLLLPLTDEQIRGYFAAALPDQDLERIRETVAAVHNLSELTQRPYTLKLVADQLPAIEARRAAGRPVFSTTLYQALVQSWLERDSAKHHVRADHKLRLAAHLAAFLWQQGSSGLLPADRLEDWFHAWLTSEPGLAARYARLLPDQLEEDLRTATFLVRQDDSDRSAFRFAHTSLLEYFLAEYLMESIRLDDPDRWDLEKSPSLETLDFLGQLLAEAQSPALLTTLGRWRNPDQPRVCKLLLEYGLRAGTKGWPEPDLRGLTLATIDLCDLKIRIPVDRPPLDLSNADLSRARLRRVILERVCLTGSRLNGSDLTQATLLNCEAERTDWSYAICDGSVWRGTILHNAIWGDTRGHRAQFLHCPGAPASINGMSSRVVAAEVVTRDLKTAPLDGTTGARPPLGLLSGHSGEILACAVSPDGQHLLSAGEDGTVRLWDGRSGVELLCCQGQGRRVNACAFSPDGQRLLSAGDDGTLRLWDGRSGEELLHCQGHKGRVLACAYSPDGQRLLSAGDDGTLRLWDGRSGEELLRCQGHKGRVLACAYSPDGRRLLSAGDDGVLSLWDGYSGEKLLHWRGHKGKVFACVFSPDGQRLISAGGDGMLHLWDARRGKALQDYRGHKGWVRACAYSPDGQRLLSAGVDGTVRLWKEPSGKELLLCQGHNGRVSACAYFPDGERLLSAGEDRTLRLWDKTNGEELLRCQGHEGSIFACAYSPDGQRLLSAGDDGTLRLWDGSNGEELLHCQGHRNTVLACVFSPDGQHLLSAGADGTLRVGDGSSGESLLHCQGHKGPVHACAFSPDGQHLLSAGADKTLRLWDRHNGKELQQCQGHSHGVNGCAFSPDGQRLLSASDDKTLRLWDGRSGEELLCCQGHEAGVRACAYSPDGQRLLSAGGDGTLRLWDGRNGEELLRCQGHGSRVITCSFSPDGQRLLSAGDDGTLRVWDGRSGMELLRCQGHGGAVNANAYSPDGQRLLSAGSDGTLRLWNASTGELLRVHAVANGSDTGHAVWECPGHLIEWSGGAWRWLAWQATDADGWPDPLPLETFPPERSETQAHPGK